MLPVTAGVSASAGSVANRSGGLFPAHEEGLCSPAGPAERCRRPRGRLKPQWAEEPPAPGCCCALSHHLGWELSPELVRGRVAAEFKKLLISSITDSLWAICTCQRAMLMLSAVPHKMGNRISQLRKKLLRPCQLT